MKQENFLFVWVLFNLLFFLKSLFSVEKFKIRMIEYIFIINQIFYISNHILFFRDFLLILKVFQSFWIILLLHNHFQIIWVIFRKYFINIFHRHFHNNLFFQSIRLVKLNNWIKILIFLIFWFMYLSFKSHFQSASHLWHECEI
jgi:hypothetical protein